MTVKPYHDCPACPRCRMTVVVTTSVPGRLFCPACGDRFSGTPEQVTQAEKADAAWRKYIEQTCGDRLRAG